LDRAPRLIGFLLGAGHEVNDGPEIVDGGRLLGLLATTATLRRPRQDTTPLQTAQVESPMDSDSDRGAVGTRPQCARRYEVLGVGFQPRVAQTEPSGRLLSSNKRLADRRKVHAPQGISKRLNVPPEFLGESA
jgi:hypothetical protein